MRIDLTTNLNSIQKEISPNESLRAISFILAHFVDGNIVYETVSEMFETSDVNNGECFASKQHERHFVLDVTACLAEIDNRSHQTHD